MTSAHTSAAGATAANISASTNHGLVGNALQMLAAGLGPYVAARLREAAGMGRYVPNDLDIAGDVAEDVSLMLKVMAMGWNEVFRDCLGPVERSLVSEIRVTRNRWAHLESFDDDDLDRALDSIGRLLAAVGAAAEAARVNQAKHRLRRKRYAAETPSPLRREPRRPAVPASSQPSHPPDTNDGKTPEIAIPHTPGVDAGERAGSLIQRGIAYRQTGELGRAVTDFEEAIGINRENAEAWYQRALTWGHMGEYQRAINDFNRAIALDGNYAHAYADRGYAHLCLGDPGAAIADFESAIQLNPGDELARANLRKARRQGKEIRESENRWR